MLDAALDLLTGSACAGCARPGRMLCAACRAALPRHAVPAWPDPTPAGLVTPWAAASYDGAVRELVVGHKEHGQLAHARVLGGLLSLGVAAAVASSYDGTWGRDGDAPVVLVPVPSRPGAVRARGHDPTSAIVRAAARVLRHEGLAVVVAGLVVSRGAQDQSGLDHGARARNVAGSMWCPSGRVARLARRHRRAFVVVCDDVVTTGATAREAQRALAAAGLAPAAVAAVAATRRTTPSLSGRTGVGQGRGSLPGSPGTR